MSQTYRALSALLSYPTPELQAAAAEIEATLAGEVLISEQRLGKLAGFVRELGVADTYDAQERYVSLFDRGRMVSLHLFEHVHGESRDRGQAMADLIDLYRTHGLEMPGNELPDFLPLFLEFLSLVSDAEARELLAEPAGILRALANRLAKRDTGYAAVMESLAELANAPRVGTSIIREENPDDLAALDAAWEESMVRFGPDDGTAGCGVQTPRAGAATSSSIAAG